jgi:hypothetical protein
MPGPDTSRGMNFQYACSIGFLIDIFEHPEWESVQFEGEQDIEDVVIFDNRKDIILRAQIKQKIDPYQWEPHEFRDVILKFAALSDSKNTTFQFIYSGSDGKSITHKLKPILQKTKYEGWNSLLPEEIQTVKDLLSENGAEFLSQVDKGFEVIKRGTWKSIKLEDLRRFRALLVKSIGTKIDEDYEETVYNQLFLEIAAKTEGTSKYFRLLTRSDIFKLIGITAPADPSTFDINSYISWLRSETISRLSPVFLEIEREQSVPDILQYSLSLGIESELTRPGERKILPELLKEIRKLVLVGGSGSGKTYSLWQLVQQQLNRLESNTYASPGNEQIPVLVDLAGYDGVPISVLICRSFRMSGLIVSEAVCEELASTGKLILLFDDFDLCQEAHKSDLQHNLRNYIHTRPMCTAVITTHTPSDGHILNLPTFRLTSLDENQARDILTSANNVSSKDAYSIIHSLPLESRHLAQAPLTLLMLAYTYIRSDKHLPRSRALLYKKVVDGLLALSEQKGFSEIERSDKVTALSLLARWMQDNEIYVISPATLSILLKEWIEAFPALGAIKNLSRLRLEIIQSGLLLRRLDTNIEFIHPSFRSFLAAQTIQRNDLHGLIEKASWRSSLLFWTSLHALQTTDCLIDIVTDDVIFLGRLVQERTEKRASGKRDITEQAFFERLHFDFRTLISRFPVFLKDTPWKYLPENRLQLVVGKAEDGSFLLHWREADTKSNSVSFLNCSDIIKQARRDEDGVPLPLFVVSPDLIFRYHSLEIAYLWIMRALYDLLVFIGIRGGINPSEFEKKHNLNPAIALVTNRFLLYKEIASGLPSEILSHLPFYANNPFQLAIEIINYTEPPVLLYAISPSSDPKKADVIQSVLNEEKEAPGMFRIKGGVWYLKIGDEEKAVPDVEEVLLGRILTDQPSNEAQQWLLKDLKSFLPLFPPASW